MSEADPNLGGVPPPAGTGPALRHRSYNEKKAITVSTALT